MLQGCNFSIVSARGEFVKPSLFPVPEPVPRPGLTPSRSTEKHRSGH
jgi:hypothetical protein